LFLASNSVLDRTFPVGLEIVTVTLPEAFGSSAVEYSLSTSIPGLTFDSGTREISGTPTAVGEYAMTYTASTAADSRTIAFHYRVVEIGTTEESASELVHASPLRGVLPSGVAAHVFRVVVDRPGDLVVAADPYTTDDYDASRVQIGDESGRSVSVENAAAGTYFVHVRRRYGSGSDPLRYHVAAWLVPLVEDGDNLNIDVRYVGPTKPNTDHYLLMQQASDYWSRVLGDTPNMQSQGVARSDIDCRFDFDFNLQFGEFIDDIIIFFAIEDIRPAAGRAGSCIRRPDSHLPYASRVRIDPTARFWPNLYKHEVGHALGFSDGSWERMGLIVDAPSESQSPPYPDTHYIGPRAIEEFNAAGGERYTGAKVPVQNDDPGGHWRESVFGCELMSSSPRRCSGDLRPTSRITLAVFEDMGYPVDYSLADPYRLPGF
jgi:hypothetical protein